MKDITPSLVREQLTLAGRISHFKCDGEVITRDAWVLNAIEGYELHLVSTPYQRNQQKELPLRRGEIETLEIEINSMTIQGAICTADESHQGFYSQMLTVPKNMGATGPLPIQRASTNS